ncbi:MAG TPA: regulatory iron-sulfur-containing complex subunit RicT [Exilispira sp.]|nr:regulatory iron-sulfur-containing complex subunit RicT [Exilispira sp.]
MVEDEIEQNDIPIESIADIEKVEDLLPGLDINNSRLDNKPEVEASSFYRSLPVNNNISEDKLPEKGIFSQNKQEKSFEFLENSLDKNKNSEFLKTKVDKIDKKGELENFNKKKYMRIEGKLIQNASLEDIEKYKENEKKASEAFKVFSQQIDVFKLEMKPVSVHYFLDDKKILFDFVADRRIDFRELVRVLASIFKKRIELHQIGVRDEARMISGIFICGQELCCKRFLHQLSPITIKMAEVQNAPLNTMKISGYCGRLLCCLQYEYDLYDEIKSKLPSEGEIVSYENQLYFVQEINVLKQYLKIKNKETVGVVYLSLKDLNFEKNEDGVLKIKSARIYE